MLAYIFSSQYLLFLFTILSKTTLIFQNWRGTGPIHKWRKKITAIYWVDSTKSWTFRTASQHFYLSSYAGRYLCRWKL